MTRFQLLCHKYCSKIGKPPPQKANDESCQIFAEAFRKSTDEIGELINGDFMFRKECLANDTIFRKDDEMDIFTKNLRLYCDRGYFISYLPRAVYLSYVIGVPVMGFLSDIFGRKRILMSLLLILGISGIGEVFTGNFFNFCILTFCRTVGVHGSLLISLLINMEIIGPRWVAGRALVRSVER